MICWKLDVIALVENTERCERQLNLTCLLHSTLCRWTVEVESI